MTGFSQQTSIAMGGKLRDDQSNGTRNSAHQNLGHLFIGGPRLAAFRVEVVQLDGVDAIVFPAWLSESFHNARLASRIRIHGTQSRKTPPPPHLELPRRHQEKITTITTYAYPRRPKFANSILVLQLPHVGPSGRKMAAEPRTMQAKSCVHYIFISSALQTCIQWTC